MQDKYPKFMPMKPKDDCNNELFVLRFRFESGEPYMKVATLHEITQRIGMSDCSGEYGFKIYRMYTEEVGEIKWHTPLSGCYVEYTDANTESFLGRYYYPEH